MYDFQYKKRDSLKAAEQCEGRHGVELGSVSDSYWKKIACPLLIFA